jgi:dTDP-4-amino-4,6-dideoxygalactose transaminase
LPNDQDATGRSFGPEELEAVAAVLASGTLTSTKGEVVKSLQSAFAALMGVGHALACSSGTSAVQAAVQVVDPEPGDEIITSPITDMGAIAPILYQTAIPVFADVDPSTGNVTAESVAARLSPRTKAVIVTHLFGNPVDTEAVRRVTDAAGVTMIEDCAQAFLASSHGRLAGTVGHIGTFSLQQGKHITTGEGGLVITDDDAAARRILLWINKAWPYGEPSPDHEFLALNARMSELQGAVALAQLGRLRETVEQRISMSERLSKSLDGLPGVITPAPPADSVHAFWRYPILFDPSTVEGGPNGVAADLKDLGIGSAPRYIQKPAFRCAVFTEQRTFGSSRFPFTHASPEALDYSADRYPGTFAFLDHVLVLPWNERLEETHIDRLADAISGSVMKRAGLQP